MQGAANESNGWFTRERVLTLTLAMATLGALYVCYLIAKPFIPSLAFALALAVATDRPYLWLRQKLGRPTLAAALAVVLVALLIFGPAAYLITHLVQQAVAALQQLQSGDVPLREALLRLPYVGTGVRWAEANLDLPGQISAAAGAIAARATDALRASISVATQLGITLFVLFFLYRDREKALRAVFRLLPLSGGEADALFTRVASTIQATVNGSLTVALVQAMMAGLMYGVLGVPGAVLWAAATFLMALVPVVGTSLVWGPVALYLVLTGSWVKGVVLVGWGMLAVGMIDNFLYPHLVGDRLRLHTLLTFFAILGGLGLFGPSGIILGPMALAVLIALLDVWWSRTAAGRTAEEGATEPQLAGMPPGAVLQERGAPDRPL